MSARNRSRSSRCRGRRSSGMDGLTVAAVPPADADEPRRPGRRRAPTRLRARPAIARVAIPTTRVAFAYGRADRRAGRPAGRRGRRPLHRPRAVVARLRRPRARPRRERVAPAPRAGQVPRNLLLGPRRVLPDPRCRAEGAGRGRAARPAPPDGLDRSSSDRVIREQVRSSSTRQSTALREDVAPRLVETGIRDRRLGRPRHARPRASCAPFERAHLPGAHAARGRPGHPFPYISQPVAQPRGRRPRPRQRRAALRPGQGAAAAPALRAAAGRLPFRAGRAGHRREPRACCSRAWRSLDHAVPRHPQRRHRARGRSRGPARGRSSSCCTAHQFGTAVRLEIDARCATKCASCCCASSSSRRTTCTRRRAARPQRPVRHLRARPPGAEGRALERR